MALCDTHQLYEFDRDFTFRCNHTIIGVDEAGRGPLAGPVVASAVQLDLSSPIEGINDSKKISSLKREKIYTRITNEAISWTIGIASWEEIDTINILQASLLAMKRSLQTFDLKSSNIAVLIDGNKKINSLPTTNQTTIVKGDGKSASIAAASIVAKVTRDRIMKEYHEKYPQYEFNRHKGYGTAIHRKNILENGLCPIHRRTFCTKLVSQVKIAF